MMGFAALNPSYNVRRSEPEIDAAAHHVAV
jgi:hypothetical protein